MRSVKGKETFLISSFPDYLSSAFKQRQLMTLKNCIRYSDTFLKLIRKKKGGERKKDKDRGEKERKKNVVGEKRVNNKRPLTLFC